MGSMQQALSCFVESFNNLKGFLCYNGKAEEIKVKAVEWAAGLVHPTEFDQYTSKLLSKEQNQYREEMSKQFTAKLFDDHVFEPDYIANQGLGSLESLEEKRISKNDAEEMFQWTLHLFNDPGKRFFAPAKKAELMSVFAEDLADYILQKAFCFNNCLLTLNERLAEIKQCMAEGKNIDMNILQECLPISKRKSKKFTHNLKKGKIRPLNKC